MHGLQSILLLFHNEYNQTFPYCKKFGFSLIALGKFSLFLNLEGACIWSTKKPNNISVIESNDDTITLKLKMDQSKIEG